MPDGRLRSGLVETGRRVGMAVAGVAPMATNVRSPRPHLALVPSGRAGPQRARVSTPTVPVPATRNPPRLLERIATAMQARHYSRRTAIAYVGWIKRFILFHRKRHPD